MTSKIPADVVLQNMSESVYVGLCRNIGTTQQVRMRRDLVDIMELIDRKVNSDQNKMMWSGSYREGFRMQGSDMDFMLWPDDHRVVWNLSEVRLYARDKHTLIIADSSGRPPGFSLLYLLTQSYRRSIQSACFILNGRPCLSSSKYRKIMVPAVRKSSKEHGPSASGKVGPLEYDNVHCLVSDVWPPCASSWIQRCCSWPHLYIVKDIVKSGCHFVPVGHRLGDQEHNEWRISFSLAEQKLVCSMNHVQLLTYGLLKLFLKEIINKGLNEKDKLLCSYHMKTAVFWVIQQRIISCLSPQTLLGCFWACFKRILLWVYKGECPNFFIPDNNMFLDKIHGEAQAQLFTQLYQLYEKGVTFLLYITAIQFNITNVLCNPTLKILTDDRILVAEPDFDAHFFREIYIHVSIPVPDLQHIFRYVRAIEESVSLPLTQFQIVVLQAQITAILQLTAFIIQNKCSETECNRRRYISDRMSRYMLKLAAKFGCISDILYIALYYFTTSRYRDALYVTQEAKMKLAKPQLLYLESFDAQSYSKAVKGKTWSQKMKHAIVQDIKLYNNVCYCSAIMKEQVSGLINGWIHLMIPPVVLLHMLEFLCYRNIDTASARVVLDDLQFLVHNDRGVFVPKYLRDISWQVLGICQQMTGDLRAALYSYQHSLLQIQRNRIETATKMHIEDCSL